MEAKQSDRQECTHSESSSQNPESLPIHQTQVDPHAIVHNTQILDVTIDYTRNDDQIVANLLSHPSILEAARILKTTPFPVAFPTETGKC